MQFTVVLGFAALAVAQSTGVFTGPTLTPTSPAPAGCTANSNGQFNLGITQIKSGSKVKRQSDGNVTDALTISLKNGVLYDQQGRIGYVAGNEQFQFDFNGQAGEKYTAGFSICANNTLALGGSAIWYECLSGNFYNIYDASWAPQCLPVYLDVIPKTGTSAAPSTISGAASSSGSGTTITSASAVTSSAAVVSSISDGQPQGGSTKPITSSSAVVTTVAPVRSSTTISSAAIISSISDHQPQGPTATTPISPVTVTPYSGNAAAMMTAAPGLLLAAAGAAVALL